MKQPLIKFDSGDHNFIKNTRDANPDLNSPPMII